MCADNTLLVASLSGGLGGDAGWAVKAGNWILVNSAASEVANLAFPAVHTSCVPNYKTITIPWVRLTGKSRALWTIAVTVVPARYHLHINLFPTI
jgi:hypothetical protein